MEKSSNKTAKTVLICGIVLTALCLSSLLFGSAKIPLCDMYYGLVGKEGYENIRTILLSVRLPRTFSGLISGAGLSLSGLLLQRVTGNRMASPNLVGVSSGAGLAVVVSLTFFPQFYLLTPLFSFAGALGATLFIVAISSLVGFSKAGTILAGLAFSSVMSALISLLSYLDSDVLVSYNAFSVGSFVGVGMKELYVPFVMTLAVILLVVKLAPRIDILTLGDEMALSLGENPKRVRGVCMVLASISAASCVSFSGLLGFVGLMAPHIAARFVRAGTRSLAVASVLVGSCLTVGADLLGRVLFYPGEMPVGIIMALVGAPFFLVLLVTGGRRNA